MKVKLADVCTCESSNLKQSDVINISGKYPVYGATGKIGYIDTYKQEKPYIAIVKDGAGIGRTHLCDSKSSVIGTLQYILPKDNVLPEYLFYVIKHMHLEKYYSGATIPHIYFKNYKNEEFNLDSINKQETIINILNDCNKLINLKETQLQKYDDLIKARFVEMFGDGNLPMKTVEELCSYVVDCPHTTPKYEGNLQNPAIRTSEIKKGFLVWDTMRYVSDEEYVERTTRAIPKAGDIVYGREGTFGNAAILPEGYKFCLGQRVMLLRPDCSKCTSEYLLHSVISDDVYRQAIEKNNASTVAHVNVKDVKQFKVPLPSLDKQNEFADFVQQVDKSKLAVQKSLEKTQQLYDSLMQEYFG